MGNHALMMMLARPCPGRERLPRGLAARLGAAGLLIPGAAAAFETTRLMGYLLYQVSPRDPVVFTAALAVVIKPQNSQTSTRRFFSSPSSLELHATGAAAP